MEPWQTVLLAFGGNAALLAILGWLGKSLLEKIIARETSSYESELREKTDSAIVRLEAELSLRAKVHEIKFSRLHEKSAETVAETYALLRTYLVAAANYTKIFEMAGEPSKDDRLVDLNKAMSSFRQYFQIKQIYLPKETAKAIRDLDEKLFKTANHFSRRVHGKETSASTEDWMKAFEVINEEIPPILEDLEDEFRKLLGHDGG
jgi:hypothetical protein